MKQFTSSIVVAGVLFTGCAYDKVSDIKNEQASMIYKKINEKTVRDTLKEKKLSKSFVNVDTKSNVSYLLEELSKIDGRVYYLKGSDILVPSIKNYKGIDNFVALKSFIESTTNKTIEITKRKFSKGIKVVEVKNKNDLAEKFKDYKFTLNGENVSIDKAMLRVSKLTGFNVVYDNSRMSSKPNAISNEIKTQLISFNKGNVLQFLNAVEISANLFIDIDYTNKMIVLSKYKSKNIPLMISDRSITKDTAESTSESEGGGNVGGADIKNTFSYSIYDELEEDINEIVKTNNKISDDSNIVTLNRANGTIAVTATSEVLNKITSIVNEFNNGYSKRVNIRLTTIELIVRNNKQLGLDFNTVFGGGSKFDFKSTVNSSSDLLKNSLKFNDGTTDAKLNSLNEIGYIANTRNNDVVARNLIPYTFDETRNTNYVKNITSTPSQVEGQEPTQATETEELNIGMKMTILPKIVGNYVSLYMSPSQISLNSLDKENFSNLEIQLPDTNNKSLENEYIMQNGESMIIGSYTTYEDSDIYEGVIPLQDFIIGGEKNSKLVRKELIYLLTVDFNN